MIIYSDKNLFSQEEVIDQETMNRLVAAIASRNGLAHEYSRVDYAEIYETLQTGLDVYDAFGQQIAPWFRTRDQPRYYGSTKATIPTCFVKCVGHIKSLHLIDFENA
ncbi:HepT-like ribonuclease domain-containing protein [Haladaptatus sp. NG-WS-4]